MSNEIQTVDSGFIEPLVSTEYFGKIYAEMVSFIKDNLRKDQDYGIVPGVTKPFLWQPGAEKLARFFGLSFTWEFIHEIEDWNGIEHGGEPFFEYAYKGKVWRKGQIITECTGSCNSWEKKYRYRQAKRKCPTCGQETIIKGKKEYGGGWVCLSKSGGCGDKFMDNEKRITEQVVGEVKNPDPHDLPNTCRKVGLKRTFVGGVCNATMAHEFFVFGMDEKDPEDNRGKEEMNGNGHSPNRPLSPEALKKAIAKKTQDHGDQIATKAQRDLLLLQLTQLCNGVELERHCLTKFLTGVASSKDLSGAQVLALLDWLGLEDHEDGKIPCQFAIQEAHAVLKTALVAEGQQEMELKGGIK